MISQVVKAVALYLASAYDLEPVDCFFVLQKINDSPKKTQYPVTDFLASGQETQSESAYAFKCN